MSPRKDWRDKATPTLTITHGEWYRSPLWKDDHALGRDDMFTSDGIAWCGRPLQLAMDGWGDPQLEGLWITNRTAAHCAECDRREREWKELQPTPDNYKPF